MEERMNRIQKWKKSEGYTAVCDAFTEDAVRMTQAAEYFKSVATRMQDEMDTITVRRSAATDCGLHRGYYCPSLTKDIVCGNVKRGHIIQQLTKRSKNYYLYGFDTQDRLIWSKRFIRGKHATTEYLIYDEDFVYGITMDNQGNVEVVTEEQYEDGHLVSYREALICDFCERLSREDYVYDSEGLHVCDVHSFYVRFAQYNCTRYIFEREAGQPVRYRCADILCGEDPDTFFGSRVYTITKPQKS